VLRLEEALERYRKRRLTGEEAGELLGVSGTDLRRQCVRDEEDGAAGSPPYVKATVRVHQYPDDQLAIVDRPRSLARFAPDGTPIHVSRGD
jgi:hypothetical protein